MTHDEGEIWTLVAKHVKGALSDSERHALDRWKESHPDNKAAVEQAEALWNKTTAPSQAYHPDVDKGWQRFRFRIDSEQGLFDTGDEPVAVEIPLYRRLWAVAASVLLTIALGYVAWQWTQKDDRIMLTTGDNEKNTYFLPDSSQVWLNENTTLSYGAGFDNDNRLVYLEGEAFFEVKKAEGRRFTVYSGLAKTEVIGTSFNVKAYQGEPVKVQVVTGKVAFSPAGEDNSIFLEPGMEAVIAPEAQAVSKQTIDDPNFRAWQNQTFEFSNTRLEKVIATLEKYYETDITLTNPALAECRYTATFKDADLQEILNVLAVTGNLTIEESGNRYVVSGTGC